MKYNQVNMIIALVLCTIILYGTYQTMYVQDNSEDIPTKITYSNNQDTFSSEKNVTDISSYDNTYEPLNWNKDLSKYEIIYECNISNIDNKASNLLVIPIDIDEITAIQICNEVFDMPTIENIKNIPWKGKSYSSDDGTVEFFGLNRIYYNDLDTKPTVLEWNITEVKYIAENFINKLFKYWDYKTEVIYTESHVGPCYYTAEIDPETLEETVTIHAIGVNYELSVNDTKLVGPGADFSIWVANGEIVSAELHYPCLIKSGDLEITITPQQAIERFIKGETQEHGYDDLSSPIAWEGACVVKSVDLSYYIDFSKEHQTYLPLNYEIKGVLKFIDPETKQPTELEFCEYLSATN